jgi:hypothetical protein
MSSTTDSSAPTHPSTEQDPCFVCDAAVVFIGHMVVDEHGDEVEVFEAVPCRRCGRAAS